MDESDHRSSPEWDEFLHMQADIGDFYLDHEAFEYRPIGHVTDGEIQTIIRNL